MPPLTAASGVISLVDDNAMSTIAQSASFQSWTRTTSAAAAKNRIFFDAVPDPAEGGVYTVDEMEQFFPCGILSTGRAHGNGSGTAGFENDGEVRLQLLDVVPKSLAVQETGELGRRFKNHVGDLIEDLQTLAESGTNLIIEDWRIERDWTMGNDDKIEDELVFIEWELILMWGYGGGQ